MDLFALKAVLGLDKSGFDKGIDEAKGKAEGFGSILKKGFGTAAKVGAVAITAASTAVVAFGKSAIEAGKTFDKSMAQVAATMGYTVEQLNTEGSEAANTYNTLREFAQKMGSETAFSASEAAEALNYMALAGYDAETSMKMLPNVLNLASAGTMSLSNASDMVTDAQSALGLTLDETSALVDKMAKASSKSNTSVSQLGEAILTIGGTANVLKGGTTELSAALGILADNGIKGAEGGTHLRNVLLSLSAPTDTAAETLASLGVKTTDASGNLRSLEDIMGDLNKSLAGMGEADKAAIISKIFNKTDIAAVNALLSTSGSRWKELSSAIDNSKGSAEAMAKTQLDNLAGDVTLFKSALEGAQIAISDGLTPTLRTFVQFGSSSLSTLTSAYKEGGLSGLTDAFGDVVSEGIGKLMDMLPNVIQAGTSLLTALIRGIISSAPKLVAAIPKLLKSLVTGIAKGLPQIGKAGKQLVSELSKSVSSALKTGFDLPSMLARLLTGGKVTWVANYSITRFVEQFVKPALKNALQNLLGEGSAADSIVKTFNQVVFSVTGVVNTLKNAFTPTIEALQTMYDTVKGLFSGKNTLSDVGTSLLNVFKSAWTGIQSIDWSYIATLLGTAVKSVYSLIVDWAKSMYNKVADAINSVDWYNLGKSAWDLVKSAFSAVVTYFKTLFGGGNGTGVRGTIEKGIDWAGLGTAMWNYITAAFGAVVDFFKPLFEDVKTAIGKINWLELGVGIWNWIKRAFSSVGGWFKEKFEFVVTKIKEIDWAKVGTDIWSSIRAAFLLIGTWFKGRFDFAVTKIKEIDWADVGTTIWNTIKSGFTAVGDWIKGIVLGDEYTPDSTWSDVGGKLWSSIKSGFIAVGDWIKNLVLGDEYTPDASWSDVGGKIWLKITEGLSSAVDWLKGLLDGWTAKLTDGSVDFTSIGASMWTAISSAFSGVVTWFKNLFGGEDADSVKSAIASIDWAGLGTSVLNFITGAFTGIGDIFKGFFVSAWDSINNLNWGGLGRNMWNAIKNAFSAVSQWFKDTFKGPINGVIDFLNSMISRVQDAVNTIVDGINTHLRITIPNVSWSWDFAHGNGGFKTDYRNPFMDWNPRISRVTLSRIKKLAEGGVVSNGGHAIVGEAGAEYLRVVNGQAVVTPIKGMNGGGDTYNTINIYQQPGQDPRELAEIVQRELVRIGRQQKAVYA